jgi:Flp pilus assembly protein TadG
VGTSRGRGRRDREQGAALVEFALIVPLLFLMLFGIIEFGFAFNDYQSVRQGVRDGARNAAVSTYGTTTACSITGASGASVSTQQIICSTKAAIGLGNTKTRVDVKLPSGTTKKGDPIIVCAQYQLQSFTGLFAPFLNNVRLRSRVETRIEKDLAPVPNAAAETPPGSGDWAWC